MKHAFDRSLESINLVGRLGFIQDTVLKEIRPNIEELSQMINTMQRATKKPRKQLVNWF